MSTNKELTKEDSTRLLTLKPFYVRPYISDETFWKTLDAKKDDTDVKEFYNSYLNSKGIQRILNNQHNWWKQRHPFRKFYYDPMSDTREYFQISKYVNPNLYIRPSYSAIFSKTYSNIPDEKQRLILTGGKSTSAGIIDEYEHPFDFILGHEYTHGKAPFAVFGPKIFDPKSAQGEALEQNTNTKKDGHDNLQTEKHADIQGLKYLLYKEGIYDSRNDKDITEKEVQQLRERYPNLRPLKQMNNKEVVFQLNHVAMNDQNINQNALYAKKGIKLIQRGQKGLVPQTPNPINTNKKRPVPGLIASSRIVNKQKIEETDSIQDKKHNEQNKSLLIKNQTKNEK